VFNAIPNEMFDSLGPMIRHESFSFHDVTSGNVFWRYTVGSASAERAGLWEVGGCTRRVQTA